MVKDCLDTGWVSSAGAYVDRLEQALADYTGVAHAVAVVNGTAALHMCCLLAGVQAGDEVLLPALTFVATANAVSYCGATPHLVDVSETTLGVDPARLDSYLAEIAEVRDGGTHNRLTGRPLRALIVMHALGHPAEMDALADVCARYGLVLIEDAAEALGSFYRGRHVGHWGRLTALSFNGNKIVTAGGGGAILTPDATLAARARHLTTTAKQPHPWAFEHDAVGFNYRMPNLNAALALAQLEQLPRFVECKRTLARRYREALSAVAMASPVVEPAGARSNYWLNACVLASASSAHRDTLIAACHERGLQVRPLWTPMHRLGMYGTCPRMPLTVTEALERALVCLPSSASLGAVHG